MQTRYFQDLKPVTHLVNAKQYGCVFDGSHDNAAQLQQLVTASAVAGADAVLLGGGTCLLGSNVTVPSGGAVIILPGFAFSGTGTFTAAAGGMIFDERPASFSVTVPVTFSGGATYTGAVTVEVTSTTAFRVQTGGGSTIFQVDTSTPAITANALTTVIGGLIAQDGNPSLPADTSSNSSYLWAQGGDHNHATTVAVGAARGANTESIQMAMYPAAFVTVAGHANAYNDMVLVANGSAQLIVANNGQLWGNGNPTFSAGADASTTLTVGQGGSGPTASRTAQLNLNAPSQAGDIGNVLVSFQRASASVWLAGIDLNGASGAKTANTDWALNTGSVAAPTYVLGLTTAGALTTAAGITSQSGHLTIADTTLIYTTSNLTNNAGSGAGTLTNAPAAGNPTKWIPIDDNGTTRNIPAW